MRATVVVIRSGGPNSQTYMVALNVPKIALAPLIIVWLGLGMQSKNAIVAIITFIIAFITAYNGAQLIDVDYVRMMRSLGARQLQIFRIVVIPAEPRLDCRGVSAQYRLCFDRRRSRGIYFGGARTCLNGLLGRPNVRSQ